MKKFKELFPDKVKLRIRFSLDNLKLEHPVDVCSAPTGVERRNEVCEAGSPLALDNG